MSAAPELALNALNAIGLRDGLSKGHGDDDPAISAIDALLVDAEILRYALNNCEGEEDAMVGFAENAVERFLDRLLVIRSLHTELSQGGAS